MAPHRYPIGIQTFSDIRKEGYLYVDKTAYIHQMTHADGKSFFLNRPRRFGKSLLVTTLESYFEGRKDLFKGLAIEKLEQEWTEYPVLHFDMSLGKHMDEQQLKRYLGFMLAKEERKWDIVPSSEDVNIRLASLIATVCERSGRQVVVLIDEYDAPLLDVVHEEGCLERIRQLMRNFYSPLKGCDCYLRFVFLTGITKFSQMSIFSELNNLTNLSMAPEYAGICGITQEELEMQMLEDVDALAHTLGYSPQEMVDALRDLYDGYHFTYPSPDVFNPFSLLSAMAQKRLEPYWFATGTPTYLIEMMRKFNVEPSQIGRMEAEKADFDSPTERMTTLVPLLYQSGYLTIKDYVSDYDYYILDFPNREVQTGLMRSLVPQYVSPNTVETNTTMRRMAIRWAKNDIDGALRLLQDFLATVPYCNGAHTEGHYQQLFYVIFSLLTAYKVDVEVRTPLGRVDIVIMTPSRIYLLELKLNRDAAAAMHQMELKDYARRFALSPLPVTKVGINFDQTTRNISDWAVKA